MDLFLSKLDTDPHFFVYAIVTVIFSIVLHELAHGWAAIKQGDRTPVVQGHMTANPVVHMGVLSFVMLLVMGIDIRTEEIHLEIYDAKSGKFLREMHEFGDTVPAFEPVPVPLVITSEDSR